MPINYIHLLGQFVSGFAIGFATMRALVFQDYAIIILIPFGIITIYFIHKDKQQPAVSIYGEN